MGNKCSIWVQQVGAPAPFKIKTDRRENLDGLIVRIVRKQRFEGRVVGVERFFLSQENSPPNFREPLRHTMTVAEVIGGNSYDNPLWFSSTRSAPLLVAIAPQQGHEDSHHQLSHQNAGESIGLTQQVNVTSALSPRMV